MHEGRMLPTGDGSIPSAVRTLSLHPTLTGHESHSSLRSPCSAHVMGSTCLHGMAHHRLTLGCPAPLGSSARGYPWRVHGHTGGRTTACNPDMWWVHSAADCLVH